MFKVKGFKLLQKNKRLKQKPLPTREEAMAEYRKLMERIEGNA